MNVTKPYEFIWFGDIHGPKPFEVTGVSTSIYLADMFWHLIDGQAHRRANLAKRCRTYSDLDSGPDFKF